MATINRTKNTSYKVSSNTEVKKAVKKKPRTTVVEQPEINLLKLSTKRLVKTVSLEKLAKKR